MKLVWTSCSVGKGKQQILEDFSGNDNIIFFGDRCEYGGNDHDIAEAPKSRKGVVHHVSGWEETQRLLKDVYS